ncbi:hypothetical protein [Streptomyces sp. A012304]|uniref:hypothetical protein n=1 Tax=Streptomyces sp. A012304 TaxID=375446 RepID=UPI002231814F|nr:hypothetical protein [Streptomyces sp. A012304]GKQ34427.1 hypothetical protein ALMP_09770 [Streptomyces sp. A012304]
MKRENAVRGKTRGSLTLDVRKCEWSARITDAFDPAGASLLLSLPRGLFVAHDREMCRAGASGGPAMRSDLDYLSGVWGFTRPHGDEMTEISEVPLLSVRVREQGLAVDLAGYPWLFGDLPGAVPPEWFLPGVGSSCLLGICFDVNLAAPDADDQFWTELGDGKAVLGQVNVVGDL